MAYRRSMTARAKLLYQQQRYTPSLSYLHRDEDAKNTSNIPNNDIISNIHNITQVSSSTVSKIASFNHGRPFQTGGIFSPTRFSAPMAYGSVFNRNMSSTVGDASDKVGIISDVAPDVFGSSAFETVVEQVAQAVPAANEVAIAAADSFFPVAALQYVINYVHVFTGLNWWASIAVTTVMIRCMTLPFMIQQLKATTKFTLLRPKLEAVKEDMSNRGMSPTAVAEGQEKMQALFKEYGVTPFTPLKGLFIQAPVFISFFMAINNMAEKVPSFKEGGTLWFLDLTTPDPMYYFPVLTALTFWITVEANMQEGMEGNPAAKTIKNVSRGFAVLTVPFTASFPKAIFCYWCTANLFSLMYGMVIKKPAVKNFLKIPIIPIEPPSPSTTGQNSFGFFEALKKFAAAKAEAELKTQTQGGQKSLTSDSLSETPKYGNNNNQKIAPTSVLSQRIRSLEKEVKGRKRGGKKK